MTVNSSNASPVMCIFGSYEPKPGEPLWQLSYEIGSALARAGFVVANGGYDGTMEASAKGAKDAGGTTLGVTCNVFSDYRGQPLQANPHIDREISTESIFERIQTMLDIGSGYVILEGGTGTLSEFGMVWEYVAKGFVEPRPIFVAGDFWKPLVDRIVTARPKHGRHIHCVNSAEEIVATAIETIQAGD